MPRHGANRPDQTGGIAKTWDDALQPTDLAAVDRCAWHLRDLVLTAWQAGIKDTPTQEARLGLDSLGASELAPAS